MKDISSMEKKVNKTEKELIRLVTAGSVDDGKSTLIGRLLHDSDQLFEDQLEKIKEVSGADGSIDFALITDGLAAEREQGITIDVAYRYFSSRKRRFIVADVPGHLQYTKNMVTGASVSEVALLLVDARKGLLEQTKRHLFICSLLGIHHVAVVINKIDLMDYSEEVFNEIKNDALEFISKLQIKDIQFIPVSSLKGDMIVNRGENLPWYQGQTVSGYLDTVEVSGDRNLIDFRFPVQLVSRPDQDFRGYAGKIESGIIRKGEEISVLPSGLKSIVKQIFVGGEEKEYAFHPQSVTLTLEDEIDISRGYMIARSKNKPESSNSFEAMVSWFGEEDFVSQKRYIIKHTTKQCHFELDNLIYKIDVDTLHRENADSLKFNDIGRAKLVSSDVMTLDTYEKNKFTGSFIIIDEITKQTVGAGMVRKVLKEEKIENKKGHVLWFTGLSGSGKSTLADAIEKKLLEFGHRTQRLDGDILREHISGGFGFDREGRNKNVEVAGLMAKLLSSHGITVVASFISPYAETRDKLKATIPNFVEIHVSTPLEVCEERDVKGLYKKVRSGEIKNFTGIDDPYEAPKNPHIEISTQGKSIEDAVQEVLRKLNEI